MHVLLICVLVHLDLSKYFLFQSPRTEVECRLATERGSWETEREEGDWGLVKGRKGMGDGGVGKGE